MRNFCFFPPNNIYYSGMQNMYLGISVIINLYRLCGHNNRGGTKICPTCGRGEFVIYIRDFTGSNSWKLPFIKLKLGLIFYLKTQAGLSFNFFF